MKLHIGLILRPEQLFKKWLDIPILCNIWDEKRLMNLSRAIHWSQTSYFWTVTTHWAKIPQKVKSIKSAKFNNIWNFFKQSGPKRNLLSETFKFCYGSNSSICILFLRGCILLRMRNRWSGSQTLFFFFTIFSKYGTMKNHQIHIPFEFDWKFMGEGESLSLLVGFSIVYQISKLVGDSDRPKRGQTSVNLEWSGLIIVPYIDNRHLMPAHNFKKVK